jgi:hypothetical protein
VPRPLLNLATGLSLVLLGTTAACWMTGFVRPRHATVFTVHPRPERTSFIRIDRHHLILSDQQMAPVGMPAGYTLDTTHFRQFLVFGPALPNGSGGVAFGDESPILTPEGAWFRHIRTPIGGVVFQDNVGRTAWRANGFYHAIDIPWWSLLLLFSLLPASRLVTRHRPRAKARPGLCPACGYDLRATPGRCPECGTTAAQLAPDRSTERKEQPA